jgi:lactate dehydrogenase-like 2-hydroxyacid dehydrogenase
LEKEVADVDAVLGTHRWTAALMDKAPRLRLIALVAVGFDMVDIDAATQRDILVTNTPDVLTDTVADLTFALMLAAARRICEMDRWLRAGQWKVAGVTPMAWESIMRLWVSLGWAASARPWPIGRSPST